MQAMDDVADLLPLLCGPEDGAGEPEPASPSWLAMWAREANANQPKSNWLEDIAELAESPTATRTPYAAFSSPTRGSRLKHAAELPPPPTPPTPPLLPLVLPSPSPEVPHLVPSPTERALMCNEFLPPPSPGACVKRLPTGVVATHAAPPSPIEPAWAAVYDDPIAPVLSPPALAPPLAWAAEAAL